MYHKYAEIHKAFNLKKSGGNKKAMALWPMRDAKADGEAYYDRRSEQHIENRSVVRQELLETHLKSHTVALEEALRRTENGVAMAQSSAARGIEASTPFSLTLVSLSEDERFFCFT